jgi:hypothetical protein
MHVSATIAHSANGAAYLMKAEVQSYTQTMGAESVTFDGLTTFRRTTTGREAIPLYRFDQRLFRDLARQFGHLAGCSKT